MKNTINLYIFNSEDNSQLITEEQVNAIIEENTDLSFSEINEVIVQSKIEHVPIVIEFEEGDESPIYMTFHKKSYLH